MTWSSISREAGQATAQGNHQRQSKVLFHAVGQEKKGSAQAESKHPSSNQKSGPTFRAVWGMRVEKHSSVAFVFQSFSTIQGKTKAKDFCYFSFEALQ